MNCPKCNGFNLDQSLYCSMCGTELRNNQQTPVASPQVKGHVRGKHINRAWFLFAGMVILIIVSAILDKDKGKKPRISLFGRVGNQGGPVNFVGGEHAYNQSNPGEELNIDQCARRGKTTIIDFYSEFCPPCRQIAPLLVRLGEVSSNIAVVRLDINRPDHNGIDWGSPLARQYNLNSIPAFVVYNPRGEKIHEGEAAKNFFIQALRDEGIIK